MTGVSGVVCFSNTHFVFFLHKVDVGDNSCFAPNWGGIIFFCDSGGIGLLKVGGEGYINIQNTQLLDDFIASC